MGGTSNAQATGPAGYAIIGSGSTGTAPTWAQLDYTVHLTNKGTNTHAQLDTHLDATSAVHGITGLFVGTTDTQTLSGKTFGDTVTTFQNTSVNAKKMKFSADNITSGQTRTLSAPDYDGNIVCSINNQTTNYALTSSNGTNAMWNSITTSVIGDMNISNVLQNDYLGANLSTVNSITTSTGIYYFTTNINQRTLLNGDSNFTRIVYGGGKYIALYSTGTPIQVYTSLDGIYFNYQSGSNLGSIFQSNYSSPYIIYDGSNFIACGWNK